MTGNENCSTATIVVNGEGADTLARGFLETVRESNRRKLSCGGYGCACTVVAYSVNGERLEIEGYDRNGLSVCEKQGTVELY